MNLCNPRYRQRSGRNPRRDFRQFPLSERR
nr:MAG TPA: hypothetical protein [Caudoviricetes sp.]